MSKNHQGGLAGSEFDSAGVIDDPVQVAVLKRYINALNPAVDRFVSTRTL